MPLNQITLIIKFLLFWLAESLEKILRLFCLIILALFNKPSKNLKHYLDVFNF